MQSCWRWTVISMTLLSSVLWAEPLSAKRLHKEVVYQSMWCTRVGGKTEVVLPDKTRVDCLTSEYAIEFDFGSKWAESIGQALYYSLQTGKKAGIVLILEKASDYKYWLRLNKVVNGANLPIKTWAMAPEDL